MIQFVVRLFDLIFMLCLLLCILSTMLTLIPTLHDLFSAIPTLDKGILYAPSGALNVLGFYSIYSLNFIPSSKRLSTLIMNLVLLSRIGLIRLSCRSSIRRFWFSFENIRQFRHLVPNFPPVIARALTPWGSAGEGPPYASVSTCVRAAPCVG